PDAVLPRLLKERVRADRSQLVGGRGAGAELHTGSEREEQARSRSHRPLLLRSRRRTWMSRRGRYEDALSRMKRSYRAISSALPIAKGMRSWSDPGTTSRTAPRPVVAP